MKASRAWFVIALVGGLLLVVAGVVIARIVDSTTEQANITAAVWLLQGKDDRSNGVIDRIIGEVPGAGLDTVNDEIAWLAIDDFSSMRELYSADDWPGQLAEASGALVLPLGDSIFLLGRRFRCEGVELSSGWTAQLVRATSDQLGRPAILAKLPEEMLACREKLDAELTNGSRLALVVDGQVVSIAVGLFRREDLQVVFPSNTSNSRFEMLRESIK